MHLIIKILVVLIVIVSVFLIHHLARWFFEGFKEYSDDVQEWKDEQEIRSRG